MCQLDLRVFGRSALTSEIEVPKDRAESEMSTGIPITYVPARNTIFLSVALGLGRSAGGTRSLPGGERRRLQRISRLPSGVHHRV